MVMVEKMKQIVVQPAKNLALSAKRDIIEE
jgi:hypothetical protein